MKKALLLLSILLVGTIQAGEQVAEMTAHNAEQRLLSYESLVMDPEEYRNLLKTPGLNVDVVNQDGKSLLVQQITWKQNVVTKEEKARFLANIQALLERHISLQVGNPPALIYAAEYRDAQTIRAIVGYLQQKEDGYDEVQKLLAMKSASGMTAADLAGDDEEIISLLTLPAVKSAVKR